MHSPEHNQAYHLREVNVDNLPPGLLTGLRASSGAGGTLRAEELQKEGAEVWVLQCPKDVKLTSLLQGKKLSLDDTQRDVFLSDEDGKKYESSCITLNGVSSETLAAILPDESGNMNLISVPVSGRIMIREAFEELPSPIIKTSPRKQRKHKLPSGIKERHPIYGVDFSKALDSMKNSSASSDGSRNKRSNTNSNPNPGNHSYKNVNTSDSEASQSKSKKSRVSNIKIEIPSPQKTKKPRKSKV